MKICWFSNYPSPYKIKCLELLQKKFKILCIYEKKTDTERSNDWVKNTVNVPSVFLDERSFSSLKDQLLGCDLLVNGSYSSHYGRKILSIFRKQNKPCLLQADGGLAVPRGPLDIAISHEMKKYNGYLSSGEETDKYFHYYKIDSSKIHHYRFTSLSRENLTRNIAMLQNKQEQRKKCSYQEKFIVLSVGQMIPRKGYDILAKAAKGLPDDIGIYIAGGNPPTDVKEIIQRNSLSHVHFIGYKSSEDLCHYYAGADLFVLPTRYDIWGLVINEALSFGLPVITTDHCVAGLEMNHQADCCQIVPSENVDALHAEIISLYLDPAKRKYMRDNALKLSQEWTLEDMADDLYKIISAYERNL